MKIDTLEDIGEFGLIARLMNGQTYREGEVVMGAGDDAAVLRVSGEKLLLATCDAQIEGVHYDLKVMTPEDVGRRAAAVNLSDIAAMAGSAKFALASLAAPSNTEVVIIEGIYRGLVAALSEHGVKLVGGNTAMVHERISLHIFLLGEVEERCMLLRSGAKPGDLICVTGSLGLSCAGLKLAFDSDISLDDKQRKLALSRYISPTPRLLEGVLLGASGVVSACIDVSDGLMSDAGHIAEQSRISVAIDVDRIPVDPIACSVAKAAGIDPLDFALCGGEDFELLFTVPKGNAQSTLELLERETGTRAAVIGEVRAGPAKAFAERKGVVLDLSSHGFDHFRK